MKNKWVKGQYHYEIDVFYCPICAGSTTYRYRVKGPPNPELYGYAIHHWIETWDGCNAF